jgi:hypothetical protein
MSQPVADGRCWIGEASKNDIHYLAGFWESKKYPGYYHEAAMAITDRSYVGSNKPIKKEHGLDSLAHLLSHPHFPGIEDFSWKDVTYDDIYPFAKEGTGS